MRFRPCPVSNGLAEELSTFIADEVLASRLDNGVRPYPGFFWFGQDIARFVNLDEKWQDALIEMVFLSTNTVKIGLFLRVMG